MVYREAHKESEAERKKKWYQENKDRIKAKQKEYRVRTGRQMPPEQKEAKKRETAERRKAYYSEHKEAVRAYQKAYREARKRELLAGVGA